MQVGNYDTALLNVAENEALLTGRWSDRDWYVEGGALTARPALFSQTEIEVPADGRTTVAVENVPLGTTVQIDRGEPQPIDDGTFEFVTAFAGKVVVRVNPPFPYQSQVIRITAYAV